MRKIGSTCQKPKPVDLYVVLTFSIYENLDKHHSLKPLGYQHQSTNLIDLPHFYHINLVVISNYKLTQATVRNCTVIYYNFHQFTDAKAFYPASLLRFALNSMPCPLDHKKMTLIYLTSMLNLMCT